MLDIKELVSTAKELYNQYGGQASVIEETVNHYMVCCRTRFQHTEPLLLSEFSDYPWQCVASDLFGQKKSKYLL